MRILKKIFLTAAISALLSVILTFTAGAGTSGCLTYDISDNKATITGCSQDAAGEIIIPSEIENCAVTAIGENAFQWCINITAVTIPDSVSAIGKGAFNNCEKLISVTIPEGVKTIGQQAFLNCYVLKTVNIPDSVTAIGSYAFSHCYDLTSVRLSAKLTDIADHTFIECSSLTDINIPGSIAAIGASAFSGCNNLKTVSVSPKNYKTINLSYDNNEFYNAAKICDTVLCGDALTWDFDEETETLRVSGTGEMYDFADF